MTFLLREDVVDACKVLCLRVVMKMGTSRELRPQECVAISSMDE